MALAVTPEGRLASSVDIGSIGLPLDEDMDQFVQEAQADAAQAVKDLKGDRKRDRLAVAETVRLAVRRAAQRWSGKKPVVQVLLREG